jgi:hypothetical protein
MAQAKPHPATISKSAILLSRDKACGKHDPRVTGI